MKNLQKFLVFLLFSGLFFACNEEVDHPITSEAISSWFNKNQTSELSFPEPVLDFYRARDFAPAWNNEQLRSSLLEELKKAEEEGLSFSDYHGDTIQQLLQHEGNNPEENHLKNRQVNLEILLTDAYLKYANHLFYGKLDPKKIHTIWGIDRKEVDFTQNLQNALEKQALEESLSDLKPQNEIYSGLKKSLSDYRESRNEQAQPAKIPEGKAIKPGEKDDRIPLIANRLKAIGVLEANYDVSTTVYDETLQQAVQTFQNQKGLANDKILGNSTIQELNLGAADRYQQLLANLERWRWYPRNLGEHYILINIPNYKLAVVKNGDTLRTHKVIAGDKTHHTPVFSDSVQYIVINPEWNIPSSIRDNEIIPKAANTPNYLQSRNMYVTGPDGERIDPSTIDWSGDAVRTYRFTQRSGASNSLGKLKIIYPNQYAIYLHDTPAQAIFNQNSRAESHGCVRVEEVVELAAHLLDDRQQWSLERIQEVISSGKTKKVEVTQPVQVHHFYWTAWRKNGETVFVNDIYNLDKAIYSKL